MILGTKCKFSHDKNVERKVEKVNIYEDNRDKEAAKRNGKSDVTLARDERLGNVS